MKNQALLSSKDTSKNLKCRLLQFLFGALRVNQTNQSVDHFIFLVQYSLPNNKTLQAHKILSLKFYHLHRLNATANIMEKGILFQL